ncbi:MAG: hypothetical protein WCI39_11690 [Gallionellaceae bacterium]
MRWNEAETIDADSMPLLATRLRQVHNDIIHSGADVLYLFYGGPAIAAAMVGAEFSNSCQVMLYHHQQGDYYDWGPMRHQIGSSLK